jgi:type I restriction enzyme S subunit
MQRLRLAGDLDARYYWYLLNAPVAREQFVFLSSTTTGLGNLNGSILGAVRVPSVPATEQRTIAAFLDRETARIDALIAEVRDAIERLKELRTALISAAVTGKIDVRDEAA